MWAKGKKRPEKGGWRKADVLSHINTHKKWENKAKEQKKLGTKNVCMHLLLKKLNLNCSSIYYREHVESVPIGRWGPGRKSSGDKSGHGE